MTFEDFWGQVNAILTASGEKAAFERTARYWFGQNVTPTFAAEAISEERFYP